MTTTALILAALLNLPHPAALRCAALVPWTVAAAEEARTWTNADILPEHLLGIVLVETGGTCKTHLVNGGGYAGAFQVHPRWSGMTSRELQGQPGAMAAGRILGRFTRRNGKIRDGLRLYSGSGVDDFVYADKVLAHARRLRGAR